MDVRRVISLALVTVALASCAAARHRKVAGPPPEYELPEEPDAWPPPTATPSPPRDAGTQ